MTAPVELPCHADAGHQWHVLVGFPGFPDANSVGDIVEEALGMPVYSRGDKFERSPRWTAAVRRAPGQHIVALPGSAGHHGHGSKPI